MPDNIYRCQRCDVEMQGRSELCVACYWRLHHACPNCMLQSSDGRYRVKKQGKPPRPVDCTVCRNERCVLYSYRPLEAK